MPRTLSFWEKKRAATDKALRELHKKLTELPIKRAPSRVYIVPGSAPRRLTHREWDRDYTYWKVRMANRREIIRTMEKWRRRIAYYDEQIATLRRTKNAWSVVAKGLAF